MRWITCIDILPEKIKILQFCLFSSKIFVCHNAIGIEIYSFQENLFMNQQNTSSPTQAPEPLTQRSWFHKFSILAPALAFTITAILLWAGRSTPVFDLLTKNQQSVHALLSGYRMVYILLLCVIGFGVVLSIAACFLCIRYGESSETTGHIMVCLLIITVVIVTVIGLRLPKLISAYDEDLAQLENGTTEEITVWLSPNTYRAPLSDFIGAQPVTRYGGIGDETAHQWEDFYMIDALGFSPAKNMLFEEMQSISWNEENRPRYRIRYTKNFRLVTSIEEAA